MKVVLCRPVFDFFFRCPPLQRRLLKLFFSFLIALFSLALSLAMLNWQSRAFIERSAETRVELAIVRLDQILSHAQIAVNNTKEYAGEPCSPMILQQLHLQVALIPDVRSVSLFNNGVIYCSSAHGVEHVATEAGTHRFSGEQLLLRSGNTLTPGASVLLFQMPLPHSNRQGILVGIDGYYLKNTLYLLSENSPTYLRVGNDVMAPDGKIFQATSPSVYFKPSDVIQGVSKNFPITVYTPIIISNWLFFLYQNVPGSLVLSVILSLLLGVLSFWGSGKCLSPRRELEFAIRHNQLVPYIQPVVTSDGSLAGGEILVRWSHPEKGLIFPDTFISFAEDTGLIVPLTCSIMEQVSIHFSREQDLIPDGFHFAFNISPRHFDHPALSEAIKKFQSTFSERNIGLILEITERQQMLRAGSADVISRLRNSGVLIALDDFGTGHSSLDYLRDNEFDFIKIDKSFVKDVVDRVHIGNIVSNITSLASSLNIRTIAEGVETEKQLHELMKYHIDYYQGYLFSRPIPLVDFSEHWLGCPLSNEES